jgi:hypothetical protein
MIAMAAAVVAIVTLIPVVIMPTVTVPGVAIKRPVPVGITQWKAETVIGVGVGEITPVERVIPTPVVRVAVAESQRPVTAVAMRTKIKVVYRPPGIEGSAGVTA